MELEILVILVYQPDLSLIEGIIYIAKDNNTRNKCHLSEEITGYPL